MTDLDKALDLAQEVIAKELEDPCEYGDMNLLAVQLVALYEQTRWIPVEEELPKADQHIEARLTVFASVGIHGVAFTAFDDITHWRKKRATTEPTDE